VSVYSELVSDSGVDPDALCRDLQVEILMDPPAPWNLPAIDVLDLWGAMNLRQMFALVSGGDTPTTYSQRMARAMRELTDAPPTLLGFDGDDFHRATMVLESLRYTPMEVTDD
jgi:hypothetical protein